MRRPLLAAALLALAARALVAGPINPPPGPVGPTYKTVAEIEPRTIINDTNTPAPNSESVPMPRPAP
ncbi:MAG: hypothetical protein U0637_14590 [Phycisphaerales bacterium]